MEISRMAFNASIHFGDAIAYLTKDKGESELSFCYFGVCKLILWKLKCQLFMVGDHGYVEKAWPCKYLNMLQLVF